LGLLRCGRHAKRKPQYHDGWEAEDLDSFDHGAAFHGDLGP
jgi:hypothetical protein